MRKHIKQLLIVVAAVLLMTGCGKQAKEVEIASFYHSDGYFQFGDMEWGSTEADAEKVLGLSFGKPMTAPGGLKIYLESDVFSLEGLPANLLCEFKADKLSSVTLMFFPKEAQIEEFWSAVAEALMEQYGNVELIEESGYAEQLQIATESQTYLWERKGSPHTTVQLTKIMDNGEFKRIDLSVNNVDIGKAPAQ